MKKGKKFITKDSGKRKVFKTGMQRDSGKKALYTELYHPLDRELYTSERMIKYWSDGLLVNVREVCLGNAGREGLIQIVRLIHNIESAKEKKPLIGGRCLSLDKRHAELMMRGAIKYERGNWKKARTLEELNRFKDSLMRHTNQYLSEDEDEDHATAIIFNAGGINMVMDKLFCSKGIIL